MTTRRYLLLGFSVGFRSCACRGDLIDRDPVLVACGVLVQAGARGNFFFFCHHTALRISGVCVERPSLVRDACMRVCIHTRVKLGAMPRHLALPVKGATERHYLREGTPQNVCQGTLVIAPRDAYRADHTPRMPCSVIGTRMHSPTYSFTRYYCLVLYLRTILLRCQKHGNILLTLFRRSSSWLCMCVYVAVFAVVYLLLSRKKDISAAGRKGQSSTVLALTLTLTQLFKDGESRVMYL